MGTSLLTRGTISGEFMANADTTIVFASAGKISSEFASLEDANWLSTSYSLGVCLAQPVVSTIHAGISSELRAHGGT